MLRGLFVDAAGVLILSGPMTARQRWEREHDKPVEFLDETLRKAVGPGWQGRPQRTADP